MKVLDFIGQLAAAIYDPDKMVMTDKEWLGILSSQSGELYPEMAFTTVTVKDTRDIQTTYQVDMSDPVAYPGLQRVKNIFFVDIDGKSKPYRNWMYYADTKMLDLLPSSKSADWTEMYPNAAQYPTFKIVWYSEVVDFSGNVSLSLEPHELDIFKKICMKEATNRILFDHVKLDRFRTLLGRSNEYVLIAVNRQLQMEIDARKKKLTKCNPMKSF
jgi:hypothetical protein